MKTMNSLLFLLFLLSVAVAAQPPPKGKALTADLGRYYFASPEAETAARADLESGLKQFGKFKGQMNTASRLIDALRAYEEVLRLLSSP